MFTPSEWLPVSKRCAEPLEDVSEEAAHRTAVNRAYYAPLMMVARRIADQQGEAAISGSSTHHLVKKSLREAGRRTPRFQKAWAQLRKIEDLRDQADYVLGTECSAMHAEDAIKRSERLLSFLDALPDKLFLTLPLRR